MLDYKILLSLMMFLFSLSIGVSLSYSQVSTVSNNSSSSCLSPQGIVNEFMSLGGVQLSSNNESQLAGTSQGTLSNNAYMNNSICNTVPTTTVNHSSPNTANNAVPKIYKSTVPSIVEVTAYNRTNHTIFKTGTGFIYDFNGTKTIITVSNLVAGKSDLTVTLSDGSSYYSNLTGYDPLTNIAILSVNSISQNKLLPLQLGNSSTLEEGQQIITVGNTVGLKNQITSGIISGLEQPIPVLSQNPSISLPNMPIGISTSLNLGNGYGGSPLLDTNGKVIGMDIGNYTLSNSSSSPSNTAAAISSPPSNIGISFAIPSNTILKIVPSLLSKGYYAHPWFGAFGTDVNLDIAKALNLNETRGFLVIDVAPSSPAKKAGIIGGDNTTVINDRPITLGGDVIQKIDNKDIQNIHDILAYIEGKKNVGDNILVTVLRNGIVHYNTVKLDSNPNYLPQLNK